MTTSMGGRWVELGGERHWVPDDQPPSPDGTPGTWHIVGPSGELGEWEWHPAPPPVLTTPRPAGLPPSQSPLRTPTDAPKALAKPLAKTRSDRRPINVEAVSRRLVALAPREPATPGARNPSWNSWRRIGRIFSWWLLFTTAYVILLGLAEILWSLDRDATDDMAKGVAWGSAVVAIPAAVSFLYGMTRLIPQLFHVTNTIENGPS